MNYGAKRLVTGLSVRCIRVGFRIESAALLCGGMLR